MSAELRPFEWQDKLELGVTKMDDEHKELIRRINILIEDLNTENLTKIKTAFDELAHYVVIHFKDEEEFMESFQFEGITVHKKIHEKLLERVGEFKNQLNSGELDRRELVDFLALWLTSHICGIDKKYAEDYMKKAA